MLRNIALLLTLVGCTFASVSPAQELDNFRFVGENTAVSAGFVTGVSLNNNKPTVSFLNVAGLSTVYDIELRPSAIINENTTVTSPASFNEFNIPAIGGSGIQFMTGKLVDPSNATLPPHWFRLTKYNNRWSGVFRIADRIYTIGRDSDNPVVDVRHTGSPNTVFQPGRRLKVSAIIDEQYLQAHSQSTPGYLHALESIHVMEGLLADTLGITVLLEQVIYQPSTELSSQVASLDPTAAAHRWLDNNATALGLTDNYAKLFFRETVNSFSSGINPKSGLVDGDVIVQGSHNEYAFTTAHYFGELLGLDSEPLTMQHWADDKAIALSSVDWTAAQKAAVDANPPAAEFTQLLVYDAQPVADPEPEVPNVIPDQFVNSESGESRNPDPLLQNDSNNAGTPSNDFTDTAGGTLRPEFIFILLLIWIRTVRSRTSE